MLFSNFPLAHPYPELLLIEQAIINPSTGEYFSGYDGNIDYGWLALLVARLGLALYLVSSAMSAFDVRALNGVQIAIRLALAVLILAKPMEIYAVATIAGLGVIFMHRFRGDDKALAV